MLLFQVVFPLSALWHICNSNIYVTYKAGHGLCGVKVFKRYAIDIFSTITMTQSPQVWVEQVYRLLDIQAIICWSCSLPQKCTPYWFMQKQLTRERQMTTAFMMSFSTTACPSGSVCLWRIPQFTHCAQTSKTLKSAPEGIPSGYNEAWMQFELELDLGQGLLKAKWRCCLVNLHIWMTALKLTTKAVVDGFLKRCKAWTPNNQMPHAFGTRCDHVQHGSPNVVTCPANYSTLNYSGYPITQ